MKEIWKDIPGYEGKFQASNLGRIKSCFRIVVRKVRGISYPWEIKEKILKGSLLQVGYYRVVLCGQKSRTVHSLVIETFIGPKPKDKNEIAHNNGIKTDNRISNLRYSTYSENNLDKRSHGTMPRGETHSLSKLKKSDVLEIRRLASIGVPQTVLAKKFNFHQGSISQIINRKRWAHV